MTRDERSAGASPGAARRPEETEYAPYYGRYISQVPEGDIREILERQRAGALAFLGGIPEARADARYAPDKWSIKEVVGHVSDCERVFAYRILCIGRGDQTPLPGFEQDDYARRGNFGRRTLRDLAAEFDTVRRASLSLLGGLDEESWARRGVANQKEVTVRALAYILAGHEAHHLQVIRAKYL